MIDLYLSISKYTLWLVSTERIMQYKTVPGFRTSQHIISSSCWKSSSDYNPFTEIIAYLASYNTYIKHSRECWPPFQIHREVHQKNTLLYVLVFRNVVINVVVNMVFAFNILRQVYSNIASSAYYFSGFCIMTQLHVELLLVPHDGVLASQFNS